MDSGYDHVGFPLKLSTTRSSAFFRVTVLRRDTDARKSGLAWCLDWTPNDSPEPQVTRTRHLQVIHNS